MMSSKNFKIFLKYFLFTVLFFVFCAFQTSFWKVLIDFLPAPQIWLIFLVFIFLKWPGYSTVFYAYFLGYILTLFTLMPLKMSWLSLLGLYCFVWIFKNRIHSASLFLFSVLCAAASLFYSTFYILLSYSLEKKMTSFLFFDRILEAGVTFLVSSAVYLILDYLNRRLLTAETWSSKNTDIHAHLNSHLGDV